MHRYSSIHALIILLAALPLAAAQPWPFCGRGNYSAGSAYETNLLDLLGTLRQNASSSASLFASGTVGAAPDAVWGLVLCRGDLSSSDCFDCVTFSARDAGRVCNRSRDLALCYNQCYVRLSNHDFLASTANSGELHLISGTNITSSDVVGYNRAVTGLLNATVQYAVQNSTTPFATGQWTGPDPGFRNIYSAAQCAADMSPQLCRSCLEGLVSNWWTTFPRSGTGARIAGSRCTLRSESGLFYTGRVMLLLPPTQAAAPAPTAVPTTTKGQLASTKPETVVLASKLLLVLVIGDLDVVLRTGDLLLLDSSVWSQKTGASKRWG